MDPFAKVMQQHQGLAPALAVAKNATRDGLCQLQEELDKELAETIQAFQQFETRLTPVLVTPNPSQEQTAPPMPPNAPACERTVKHIYAVRVLRTMMADIIGRVSL